MANPGSNPSDRGAHLAAALRVGAPVGVATSACALAGAFGGPWAAMGCAVVATAALTVLAHRAIFAPLDATLTAIAQESLRDRANARDWTAPIVERLLQQEDAMRARAVPIATRLDELGSVADLVADLGFAIAGNAEQTSDKTRMISSHIDRVNSAVEVVSDRMSALSRTIHDVAASARAGGEVGRDAVEATRHTDASVSRLGQSSAEIGNVVKLIDSIAEQTNLLALNATIEAARAGDAGRGFAVVANEVRELANETAKATGDITLKIQTIQSDTQNAVTAIRQISEVVDRINEIQTSIAGAVVEQAAAADAIQRSVKEAADSGVHIRANMAGLTTAAGSTASGAEETRNAIGQFTKMTAELRGLAKSLQGQANNA